MYSYELWKQTERQHTSVPKRVQIKYICADSDCMYIVFILQWQTSHKNVDIKLTLSNQWIK